MLQKSLSSELERELPEKATFASLPLELDARRAEVVDQNRRGIGKKVSPFAKELPTNYDASPEYVS